ncbi:DeoR family transcriptional regulator [Iocasia frigidifontis]|uniref:DeoR family transcriptional regulator n=1 Tax=Iocasia fonsfrigidae TaxID=2682810 RepID=A0A8A7KJ22_9FIRM|nr:DeoR/GlpR family DNA-binding transcription regulator [Iocasia fonsfrigidae]QTL99589.1 DeoR family transcriptional regulator [Iocasia fonsfrigidae]
MKLQRIEKIKEYIKLHRNCTSKQLCDIFNVSMATMRRDINELAKRGVVKKVYGGVSFIDNKDSNYPNNVKFSEKLDRIGKQAASLVEDGDIILISSGTTTYHMIPHLRNKKNLTVITNNVLIITEALKYNNFRLIVIGGDLQRNTNSIISLDAVNLLEKVNAHKLFMGTNALSLTAGLTNSSFIEAQVKQTMINTSNKTIVLLDHNKFDAVSLYTFLHIKDLDILITDKEPDKKYIENFKENNIQLIVANEKSTN